LRTRLPQTLTSLRDHVFVSGHDAEVRAFRLVFDASAEQLHADLQYKLNIVVRLWLPARAVALRRLVCTTLIALRS
jgi:hypothetical protein